MNNSKEKLNDELLESVSGGGPAYDEAMKQLKAAQEAADQSYENARSGSVFNPNPGYQIIAGAEPPLSSPNPFAQTN